MSAVEKIHARKCSVRELKSKKEREEFRKFIEANHLQGMCRNNTIIFALYRETEEPDEGLGLFKKEELIMAISLGSPRFNRNFQYELVRECSKKDVLIRGGFSKLWKAFLKTYEPESVITYTSVKEQHLTVNTNHYVLYGGFQTLKHSTTVNNKRYVSKIWPREDTFGHDYAASSIVHYGPDRILGTKLGNDSGSNHEIMTRLGYELESHWEPSPQVDIWSSDGDPKAYLATKRKMKVKRK